MESNQTDSASITDHLALGLMVCLTLIYRLFLMPRFAGWEESDYGNLAMVRGVYESGFTHFDMNHMPGYYALGGLALLFTDNTEVAAKAAALLPNIAAVLCALWLCQKQLGTLWSIGLWFGLTFQPELALYSTSALREPSYGAWLVLFLLCLHKKSYWFAGLCAALAFSVRFEAPLVLSFVLLYGGGVLGGHRWFKIAFPMILSIVLWMLYCQIEHGTWQFWGHAAAVNVETGLGTESLGLDWLIEGLQVSFQLATEVLPWRMGLGLWLCLFPGLFVALKDDTFRWIALTALGSFCVWLGIAAVAQHEVGHNLYWKWMYPVVLLLFIPAILGLKTLVRPLSKGLQFIVVLMVFAQAGWSYKNETSRQLARSQALYAPQVALAKWVEQNVPEGETIVLDNIPACYINRRPNDHQLISWFDIPAEGAHAFSDFLLTNEVSHVLWFKEEWTQAPLVAPFLKSERDWQGEGVSLTLIDEDSAYGWRWFSVRRR